HLILESSHPSPFSAHKGFFNKNHFIKANEYLNHNNIKIIEW
ncbi:MAG: uracil-DNA glycosylase, partial [Bacteroidota bacterium]|nr:uracil-DNA glycosylase [Bacteroidota bacterium]